jgi:plasmid stabilization system protein ParE
MTYRVVILPEAERDADRIYRWIADRSVDGADRWYGRFLAAMRSLASGAETHSLAPESEHVSRDIRQLLFKTTKGLRYRMLFTFTGTTVYVLHVRGPGQQLVRPSELRTIDPND